MRSHSPLQMETKRTDVDGKTLKRTALLELIVQSSQFFSSLFQSAASSNQFQSSSYNRLQFTILPFPQLSQEILSDK